MPWRMECREIRGPQFLPGNPAEGSGIVGGEGGSFIGHLAAEEAVGCVDHKARIFVAVGQGEEEFHIGNFQSRFLAHLAATAVGEGFAWVHETARQVECSLRGWQCAAHNEKFAPLVLNQSNGGGGRIVVIRKSTMGTALAAGIVFGKGFAAADGAKAENG